MATKKLTHPLDSSRTATEIKHYTTLEHSESMPPKEWKGANCGVGPHLYFDATDAELIEHNLIDACDLPSKSRGWTKHFYDGKEYWHAKRMTDGRVSFCISSSLARRRDAGFMKLMAELAMLVD